MSLAYHLLERGLVPEWLIRVGIRQMLKQKKDAFQAQDWQQRQQTVMDFVRQLRRLPIAIDTQAANEQHYEVPAEFFDLVLGPRRKYSSGYWAHDTTTFQESEEAMLKLSCERAGVQDGQVILDLGCGWGALSLWLAQQYPHATIVGLSNSHSQREWILKQANSRGLHNLKVWTGNIVDFDTDWRFDRILSVEMFEHMKNYQLLLAKLNRWLKPGGQLFVHIFTHQTTPYHFEDTDGTDWLTRYFFTGGTMPSHHLLAYFQDDLTLVDQWAVNGSHYQKTSEAWLQQLYAARDQVWPILRKTYAPAGATHRQAEQAAQLWFIRWQVFFLACAELWGYDKGQEWLVSHYLFKKRGDEHA
jgi:cyclopropane-fatty-acyl-phospholipid synthase